MNFGISSTFIVEEISLSVQLSPNRIVIRDIYFLLSTAKLLGNNVISGLSCSLDCSLSTLDFVSRTVIY